MKCPLQALSSAGHYSIPRAICGYCMQLWYSVYSFSAHSTNFLFFSGSLGERAPINQLWCCPKLWSYWEGDILTPNGTHGAKLVADAQTCILGYLDFFP